MLHWGRGLKVFLVTLLRPEYPREFSTGKPTFSWNSEALSSPQKNQAVDTTNCDLLVNSPSFAFLFEGSWILENYFKLHQISPQKNPPTVLKTSGWSQALKSSTQYNFRFHVPLGAWKESFSHGNQNHNSFSMWATLMWYSQVSLLYSLQNIQYFLFFTFSETMVLESCNYVRTSDFT